ncbi:DgyrCDS6184 [Dimorphilus gyrociliatus]|uniref:DgyrCDS6184 n=1 Tax=Dimorphilus gyrociliatus TaxID=2664684 RepID=A0A7I8VNZ1_9ANNE|nr:DgyrCDS6184 [Dimorphilus gyrociliatus]
MSERVAVITGANTGIGFSLAERLLTDERNIQIWLACRNVRKANEAKDMLRRKFPDSFVRIVQLDTSNIGSVLRAAETLKRELRRLDLLYLNAGIMPVTGFDFQRFISNILSKNAFEILSTGEALMKQSDNVTSDGYQETFATNVFGHFVLARKLKELMACSTGAKIIWTSSSNANKRHFDLDDIQHARGKEPYSSSKYLIDLVSVAMNAEFSQSGITSSVVNPGLVLTNMTFSILPIFLWYAVMPILFMLQINEGDAIQAYRSLIELQERHEKTVF